MDDLFNAPMRSACADVVRDLGFSILGVSRLWLYPSPIDELLAVPLGVLWIGTTFFLCIAHGQKGEEERLYTTIAGVHPRNIVGFIIICFLICQCGGGGGGGHRFTPHPFLAQQYLGVLPIPLPSN